MLQTESRTISSSRDLTSRDAAPASPPFSRGREAHPLLLLLIGPGSFILTLLTIIFVLR